MEDTQTLGKWLLVPGHYDREILEEYLNNFYQADSDIGNLRASCALAGVVYGILRYNAKGEG